MNINGLAIGIIQWRFTFEANQTARVNNARHNNRQSYYECRILTLKAYINKSKKRTKKISLESQQKRIKSIAIPATTIQKILQFLLITTQIYFQFKMGAVTCCQNEANQPHSDFREYCLNTAHLDYKQYFAAIQHEEYNSSPELVTQKRQYKQGNWKKGQPQTGKGVIYVPDQFYYEGQIAEGVAKGEGRIIWPNKSSYRGNIVDNKATGSGELHLGEKNAILKGNWVRGYPKLNNKMTLVRQSKEGSITFVEPFGLKTQQEFFKEETLNVQVALGGGVVYEGEIRLKNHVYKIEGKGLMKYPDGSYYDGHFVGGKMDGHGKYYWHKTGNWFEGQYKDNVREGKGTYYYSLQDFEKGEWKGGVLLKGQAPTQNHANSQHSRVAVL